MSAVDRDRAEYLAFARRNPSLFVNPEAGGFGILLDSADIDAAAAQAAERLRQRGQPVSWAHVGIVHRDQYGILLRDAVRFPNGSLGTYIRFVQQSGSPPGVAVLPHAHGDIVLVRHFRHATRDWHLEIPRGFGEPDATAEENARRELTEELGAAAVQMIPLGRIHTNTGLTGEFDELWYADIDSWGAGDAAEAISHVVPVSVSELERLMRDGEMTDSYTIAAFTQARLHGLL